MVFTGPDLLQSIARTHCHSADQKEPNIKCHEFFHWNLHLTRPSSPKTLKFFCIFPNTGSWVNTCIKLSRCIIICRIEAKGSGYSYTNMSSLCMQFFGVLMQVSHLDTYTLHQARCDGYAALDFLCKCQSVPESLLKLTRTCVFIYCFALWI